MRKKVQLCDEATNLFMTQVSASHITDFASNKLRKDRNVFKSMNISEQRLIVENTESQGLCPTKEQT